MNLNLQLFETPKTIASGFHIEDVSEDSEPQKQYQGKEQQYQQQQQHEQQQQQQHQHSIPEKQFAIPPRVTISNFVTPNFLQAVGAPGKAGIQKKKQPKMQQTDFLTHYDENFDDVFGDKVPIPPPPQKKQELTKSQEKPPPKRSKKPQKSQSEDEEDDDIMDQFSVPKKSSSRQQRNDESKQKPSRPPRPSRRKKPTTTTSNKKLSDEDLNQKRKYDPDEVKLQQIDTRNSKKEKKQEKGRMEVFTFGLEETAKGSNAIKKNKQGDSNDSESEAEPEQKVKTPPPKAARRRPPRYKSKEAEDCKTNSNYDQLPTRNSRERSDRQSKEPKKMKEMKPPKEPENNAQILTNGNVNPNNNVLDMDTLYTNPNIPECKPNYYFDYVPKN